MSENTYVVAIGVVQFDPNTREVNNQTVTDLTIKTPGSDGKLIRVTIWPEFQLPTTPKKGDVLVVDGKFSVNTYEGKDGRRSQAQISPTSVTLIPSVVRADREVVNSADDSIF
jgi:single-stranded DNA-binding protein